MSLKVFKEQLYWQLLPRALEIHPLVGDSRGTRDKLTLAGTSITEARGEKDLQSLRKRRFCDGQGTTSCTNINWCCYDLMTKLKIDDDLNHLS
jgi:hypothetical protein